MKNLVILVAALLATVVVGTAGFMLIEHLGLVDAVYMTVITLSTVGFGEVKPLSEMGRLFTIVLVVIGVGLIAYTLGTIIEFVVSGELTGLFRRRAMEKRLAELDGHYIICGYGRVGEAVAKEFARNRSSFVVVDRDPETVARIVEEGFLVLQGDATVDEILVAAGVERATGLVAAVNTDADNTFVVLSARVLNPKLIIVARANSDETIGKLEKAGATRVISPYGLGGRRMASILLQPLVTDYLEVVTGAGELSFRLEEFALNATCEVVGRSIKDLDIRRQTGASILAVRHGSGAFNTNPDPDLVLCEEDTVVAIGTPEEMVRLEQHFACRLPAR